MYVCMCVCMYVMHAGLYAVMPVRMYVVNVCACMYDVLHVCMHVCVWMRV